MKRMLPPDEAAEYCHLPKSTFPRICPVRPIKLHEKAHPDYDRLDLDRWIDSVKRGYKMEKPIDDLISAL